MGVPPWAVSFLETVYLVRFRSLARCLHKMRNKLYAKGPVHFPLYVYPERTAQCDILRCSLLPETLQYRTVQYFEALEHLGSL